MKLYRLFLTVLTCVCWSFSAHAISVSDLRFSNYQNGSVRIVIESNAKITPKIFTLSKPDRLVIDLPQTVLTTPVKQKQVASNPLILNNRFGTDNNGQSRIVFDLKNPVLEKHFTLPPQGDFGVWRLVVDLTASSKNTPKKSVVVKKTPPTTSIQPFKKRQYIVMLDPGHGGKDPGAISKKGNYEKHLTLKMALETKKLLEQAGYKVFLTRDKDIYLTLRSRVIKAHEKKADLFISIHADSAKNKKAKGLSIYTISEVASDKEAEALARSENQSDILFGMDLEDYQKEVSSVLIDLAKQETMKESRRYADLVVDSMRQKVQLRPNAHRFAGFAVLKSANVPSVLLEMGYLSNTDEDSLMQKSWYRQKLSKALVEAIKDYFQELEK